MSPETTSKNLETWLGAPVLLFTSWVILSKFPNLPDHQLFFLQQAWEHLSYSSSEDEDDARGQGLKHKYFISRCFPVFPCKTGIIERSSGNSGNEMRWWCLQHLLHFLVILWKCPMKYKMLDKSKILLTIEVKLSQKESPGTRIIPRCYSSGGLDKTRLQVLHGSKVHKNGSALVVSCWTQASFQTLSSPLFF